MLEDCMFRIQALNMLLHIAEEFSKVFDKHEEGDLKSMIEKVLNIRGESILQNIMDKLTNFFATVGPYLDQELPESPYANSLDKRKRLLRNEELRVIKEDLFQMERDLTDAKSGDDFKESKKVVSTILEGLTDHLSSIKHLCSEVKNPNLASFLGNCRLIGMIPRATSEIEI